MGQGGDEPFAQETQQDLDQLRRFASEIADQPAIEGQHQTGHRGARGGVARLMGQKSDLAKEVALLQTRHLLRHQHGDLSRCHDVERIAGIAHGKQNLAGLQLHEPHAFNGNAEL